MCWPPYSATPALRGVQASETNTMRCTVTQAVLVSCVACSQLQPRDWWQQQLAEHKRREAQRRSLYHILAQSGLDILLGGPLTRTAPFLDRIRDARSASPFHANGKAAGKNILAATVQMAEKSKVVSGVDSPPNSCADRCCEPSRTEMLALAQPRYRWQ